MYERVKTETPPPHAESTAGETKTGTEGEKGQKVEDADFEVVDDK
jgi:hypothetical protein